MRGRNSLKRMLRIRSRERTEHRIMIRAIRMRRKIMKRLRGKK
jgi:hypothetical protein